MSSLNQSNNMEAQNNPDIIVIGNHDEEMEEYEEYQLPDSPTRLTFSPTPQVTSHTSFKFECSVCLTSYFETENQATSFLVPKRCTHPMCFKCVVNLINSCANARHVKCPLCKCQIDILTTYANKSMVTFKYTRHNASTAAVKTHWDLLKQRFTNDTVDAIEEPEASTSAVNTIKEPEASTSARSETNVGFEEADTNVLIENLLNENERKNQLLEEMRNQLNILQTANKTKQLKISELERNLTLNSSKMSKLQRNYVVQLSEMRNQLNILQTENKTKELKISELERNVSELQHNFAVQSLKLQVQSSKITELENAANEFNVHLDPKTLGEINLQISNFNKLDVSMKETFRV
ncbi:pe38 [Oxyplax ochracea nucleopolyhedrovirus]|uniref:Pe38 n=1 Tax=Oxyplax ochracea nucleopolyhedrovirus TaxID=2083176 RepID=A0A2L0WTZ1_9ABAC|nr:pe38 [Oxyplax ochracea nucleopolyhedrovirus]AVA31110.1 pe38 [Oxyplax ochracea nucleopolyhedrovirus]